MIDKEKKDSSISDRGTKPHKWEKEIIAWANGAKIEYRPLNRSDWVKVENPTWNHLLEYRIYDPLREVKEAFERGETIQGRMGNFSIWNDYSISLGTMNVESIKDSNGWKWRIKPDNKLEKGKDYIHINGECLIINRSGDNRNLGFTNLGVSFRCDLFCYNPEEWREASKEEVKCFFKRYLTVKYGGGWRSVQIKKSMYNGENLDINRELYREGIAKRRNGEWVVWNSNGCLFRGGKWAEVLDENAKALHPKEDFKVGDWITQVNNKFVYKIEKVFMGTYKVEDKYHLIPKNSCRKATKHEVLNASNYYGSASTQDFPLEEGDWIIYEDRGPSYKAFAYNNNSGIRNILHKYRYATKREIEVSKALEYVPFEEEDKEQFRGKWIKRKDSSMEMKIARFETLSTNTFLIEGKCSKYLFENYIFLDGTPFGKIKQ